jgi:hypothetical protein
MIGPQPAHRRSTSHLAATVLPGRAGSAANIPAPYVVVDLGRGLDPHQARCRRCRWRSCWWATAAQARAEHDRHQLAARGRGRHPGRRSRLGLVARWGR